MAISVSPSPPPMSSCVEMALISRSQGRKATHSLTARWIRVSFDLGGSSAGFESTSRRSYVAIEMLTEHPRPPAKPLPGSRSLIYLDTYMLYRVYKRVESFEIIAEPNRRAILSLLV